MVLPTTQALCALHDPLHAAADRLAGWGRSDWLAVLHRWLARYHGIEGVLAASEEFPAHQVHERLAAFTATPSDAELAEALARLDFLSWRIARGAGDAPRWNPLAEPLCAYLDGATPVAWQWEDEFPCATEIAAWLLAELERVRAARV